MSQDHQTDELVKLWAYEQEMASTGHNDVKVSRLKLSHMAASANVSRMWRRAHTRNRDFN